MEEKFTEWLIQKRLEWLIANGCITSEDALETELMAGLNRSDEELRANEKVCLAIFIDRVAHEREVVYRRGVLDGIQLMKEIYKKN